MIKEVGKLQPFCILDRPQGQGQLASDHNHKG